MRELKIFNWCRAEHRAIRINRSCTLINLLNPGRINSKLDWGGGSRCVYSTELFDSIQAPTALTGLHSLSSRRWPPWWPFHPHGSIPHPKAALAAPGRSAGENSRWRNSHVPAALMDQTKVRSSHPQINVRGAVHSQTVCARPICPGTSWIPPALVLHLLSAPLLLTCYYKLLARTLENKTGIF